MSESERDYAPAASGSKRAAIGEIDELESGSKPPKRPKSSKACSNCRQQKTRCESVLGRAPGAPGRCHRCFRLNMECSFEKSPPPIMVFRTPTGAATEYDAPSSGWNEPTRSATASHAADSPTSRAPSEAQSKPPPTSSGANTTPAQNGGDARHFRQVHPLTPATPPRKLDGRIVYSAMEITTTSAMSRDPRQSIANTEQWAAPFSFVDELMEDGGSPHRKERPQTEDDLTSQGVVSTNQAHALSTIWGARYAIWHPLELAMADPVSPSPSASQPSPHGTSVFLQAAQWTLAARHLPSEQISIALQVHLLQILDQRTSRALLGLDRSLSAIRALCILATWTSTFADIRTRLSDDEEGETGVCDGELLFGAAMHLASQMHLEADVETVCVRKSRSGGAREGEAISAESLDRVRTMLGISAANLLFNLGNGRLSSTRVPLELAERIFGAPPLLASRTKSGGDAYLVYQCNCLAIALRVAELCTSGDAIKSMGAKSWAQKIKDEFQALDRLQQSLSTTSALAPMEQLVPATTAIMIGHFLRVNLIFRAFMVLHRVFPGFQASVQKKSEISTELAGEYIHVQRTSEHKFSTTQEARDSRSPSPSPSVTGSDHPPVSQSPPRRHPAGSSDGGVNGEAAPPHSLPYTSPPIVHEWGLRLSDTTSSFLAASMLLNRQSSPFPSLACAPDHICRAILFGATFAIKMSIMAVLVWNADLESGELTKSILERLLEMFRLAGQQVEEDISAGEKKDAANALAARCATALSAVLHRWDQVMEDLKVQRTFEHEENVAHGSAISSVGQSFASSSPNPTLSQTLDQPLSVPSSSLSYPTSNPGNLDHSTSIPGPSNHPQPQIYPRSDRPRAPPFANISHISSMPSHPYRSPVQASHPMDPPGPETSYKMPPPQHHQHVHAPSPHVGQGDMFGLPINFDMTQFYDPAFLFQHGGGENNGFSWPS